MPCRSKGNGIQPVKVTVNAATVQKWVQKSTDLGLLLAMRMDTPTSYSEHRYKMLFPSNMQI